MTGLRALVAQAMARDLCAFVLPGEDVARARGLDLAGAGLHRADTPRHANLLLLAGPMPPALLDAACVVWAQMPRPRAILALDAGEIAPLPGPDARAALSQEGLLAALSGLRRTLVAGAFAAEVVDFDAPPLAARIEYTCPMHPEVVSDEPGRCPKCGMDLVERATSGTGRGGQGGHGEHGGHGDAGGHAEHGEHGGHGGHGGHTSPAAPATYACPMHPEVTSDRPGSCPKCGMDLVPTGKHAGHAEHSSRQAEAEDGGGGGHGNGAGHGGHAGDGGHGGHGGHGSAPDIPGIEPHFMSMAALTEGKPASPDGLIMEWTEAPFGPFFPGLPGGLGLAFTLDGDSVAEARVRGLPAPQVPRGTALADLPGRLAEAFPLTPFALRSLGIRAIAAAAGAAPPTDASWLERERIASHLNWLAGFARQTGLLWLERRAGALHRRFPGADAGDIAAAGPGLRAFLRRVRRTPLLRAKLAGIGRLGEAAGGPAARAAGMAVDARTDDPAYAGLDFAPVTTPGGDALARLAQRCAEIEQSLDLIARAGAMAAPALPQALPDAGHGMATVETARGPAVLHLKVAGGAVESAHLTTPFDALAALVPGMVAQMELADALAAIGSLDLDPWGAGA